MISGFVCYPFLLGSLLYFDGQKYTSVNRPCCKLKTQKKGKTFTNQPERKKNPASSRILVSRLIRPSKPTTGRSAQHKAHDHHPVFPLSFPLPPVQ